MANRPRRKQDAALTPPPKVPLGPAVASLKARIDFITKTLGVRHQVIAVNAQKSERLLRGFRENPDTWNPHLDSLLEIEDAIDRNMDRWLSRNA